MVCGRLDQSLKEVGPEGRNLALCQDSFLLETDEIENAVKRFLLPFEVFRLLRGEPLLRGGESGQALLLKREWEHSFAERGDCVMEGRVVGWGVCGVDHLLQQSYRKKS